MRDIRRGEIKKGRQFFTVGFFRLDNSRDFPVVIFKKWRYNFILTEVEHWRSEKYWIPSRKRGSLEG